MAAKTTRNPAPCDVACAAICVASARCGRPGTEKIGSFWPWTSVVRASMTEIPVSTGSCGGSRCTGLSGHPLTGRAVGPVTGGPPSRGSPRPLQTRPSQSSPTATCSGRPANRTRTPPGAIPSVPSRTCSVARSRSTSSTRPWRSAPPTSTVANSSQPTPSTSPRTSSGPRSSRTSLYATATRAAGPASSSVRSTSVTAAPRAVGRPRGTERRPRRHPRGPSPRGRGRRARGRPPRSSSPRHLARRAAGSSP